MLARRMATGTVARIDLAPSCAQCGRRGRCAGVGDGGFELYRWVEPVEAAAGAGRRAVARHPRGADAYPGTLTGAILLEVYPLLI
jgi:hypothetical protein